MQEEYPTEEELEEIENEIALNWAREQNAKTKDAFQKDNELFPIIEKEALDIMQSKDKIPFPSQSDGYFYNFWQDDNSIRGIWRRTTLEEYEKHEINWETLIDFDELADKEDENWVFEGTSRHTTPDGSCEKCIISLSRGGKDANVKREYSMSDKKFVEENGFYIKEAKSSQTWLDDDTMLIEPEIGEDSLSNSGYPTQVRLLKRNQKIEDSEIIFECPKSNIGSASFSSIRPEKSYFFIQNIISYYDNEYFCLNKDSELKFHLKKIEIPKDSEIEDIFQHKILFQIRSDWKINEKTYIKGSLAYGGFEISNTPYYSGVVGKTWLQRGGVYVCANIRGGGEFGPSWHQAGLKEKRQNIFDDFESVAKDLISKKITKPEHLGIEGGSNGGLLVGVAFTQNPHLFGAVVCAVPLLDMLKYHKFSAGASWMGEYGNPDVPEEKKFLEKYSPYQNIIENTKYPEVLFLTSTKDDRVHPSHARKMVAKMSKLNHKVFYFETIEGGHSVASNLKQRSFNYALQTVYFINKLFKR